VYDCINKLQLIPVRDYAPEKVHILPLLQVLPPHLSPFDNQEEQNAVIDEEVLDSDQEDALDGPRVEAPVNKPKSAKAQKKLQLQSEKEKERMAQSTLTRKNKRLYDMIRTKELEKQEKLKQLQAKRK
jgi:pescadillo protein